MNSISIALCTYNGARYLDEQLLTLRAQEGVSEIVAVDDRSSDDTWSILGRHAAADPRFRLFRNPAQLGVARNFERALGLVTGEWVALSDQDDIWLPGKIAWLRAVWDGRSCLLHHATHKFHGTAPAFLPSPAGERRKFSGRDLRRLLYRNTVVGHTTLVRTDVVRQLMPFSPAVAHDWWIGAGAALLGRVQYVDEYLSHYRIHETNAYHASGSRVHRLRTEHGLRLRLLQHLVQQPALAGTRRQFVRDYLGLLEEAEARWFSWALWRFYDRHAGIFFGGSDSRLSRFRRLRKSLMAAAGAMGRRPWESGRGAKAAVPLYAAGTGKS